MSQTATYIRNSSRQAPRDPAVDPPVIDQPDEHSAQETANSITMRTADGKTYPVGTVVSVVEPGLLVSPAARSYDRAVVGIVLESLLEENGAAIVKIATNGLVRVRVSLAAGQIAIGDLLVASTKPGVAVRARDPYRAIGAIAAKALEQVTWGETPDGAECLIYALAMH